MMQYPSLYMGHDMIISWYIAIWCILQYLQYSLELTQNVKTAEIQVVAYDLGSRHTSHDINIIGQTESKQFSSNFLSNLFEQYWQIAEHM